MKNDVSQKWKNWFLWKLLRENINTASHWLFIEIVWLINYIDWWSENIWHVIPTELEQNFISEDFIIKIITNTVDNSVF